MLKDLKPRWDIESIFPGGSDSKELEGWLEQLTADLGGLQVDTLSGISMPASYSKLPFTNAVAAARLAWTN